MRRFDSGERGAVVQLGFRPDGAGLTAAFRRAARLGTWDVASGDYAAWDTPRVGYPTCFAYNPDGTLLAVGGTRGIAVPVALPGGRPLAELPVAGREGIDTVHAVAFAPSADPRKRWLAAAGAELWLWNPATPEYLCTPHEGWYRSAAFSPDGATLYAADRNDLVGWSVKPLRELFRYWIGGAVTRVAAAPCGRLLAATAGELVRLASSADGSPRRSILHRRAVRDVAFSPDGRWLAVADGSRVVTLYDPVVEGDPREYDWGVGKVAAVAFSPDGTMAAAGGEKGHVAVWDLDG